MTHTEKKQQTIDTYNRSADALAQKFNSLGARASDIDETFLLANKNNPRVLEIGCGSGRDAEVILKKTSNYLGIDASSNLIELCRQKVPGGRFEVVDVTSYEFPVGLDVVFAFASLIHVQKEDFRIVLQKIFQVLNPRGIVRISLKYADSYTEVTEESEFGVRTYYHYSAQDIEELGADFTTVVREIPTVRGQKWLEVLLQK